MYVCVHPGLIPVVKLVTRDAGQEESVEWNVPQQNINQQDGKFCIDLGNLEGVPNPFPPILEVTVANVTTAVTMLRNIAGEQVRGALVQLCHSTGLGDSTV